jgi:hypothetical protein
MPRHDKDKLVVQVAIEVRAPEHIKVTKKVLDEVLQRLVDGRPIPPNVTVRGIFWRNPNRRGDLSDWRYHTGADLSSAPTDAPLESSPRGSLQDAISTLAPFLGTGAITFR